MRSLSLIKSIILTVGVGLVFPIFPSIASSGNYELASGGEHSLALRITDGKVWAWGDNDNGQLGIGNTDDQYTPQEVIFQFQQGEKIVQIAAGGHHSLSLDDAGHVWSWGLNDEGQLGIESTNNESTPVQVKDSSGYSILENIIYIAAGAKHSLAVTEDGNVWAWGWNEDGQVGNGETGGPAVLPVKVSLINGTLVDMVSAGDHHSLALTTTGNVLS